ncbi:proline--tRNA ligase [Pajaroellobacter abortibovis]|uniref:Proline--tRNA ligase n=1 Tax=Pajaroellobacter abortibovis TaxID=1882918 RepID=A0A1L6MZD8_9BACT|nr:proline--tRNA ligase [Pajaroellobacter abortibovis]APS00795.1 proline--tRNA ligase [Pajaroellobacter abortibovis]
MTKKHADLYPTRAENYPEWYQQVIKNADLAEVAPVRGCMVIKPWGYGIWENIQRMLDLRLKATGHVNAYFPLLIPQSLLKKEAEHVQGFAKECAVVTHSRLEEKDGDLIPTDELEEPLIIRPTSEAVIGSVYSGWIHSYRDLPLLVNQWANVIRWERRTRLFLRTTEFLWQEGHTCHATKAEAIQETLMILDLYVNFAKDCLAMPVIKGIKTPGERFPGALETYSIEAMMQDRKALQAGTSHFLGQNFAKAAEIKFLDREGLEQYVWTTSWGVSTRLVGALIMTHSDDYGLVLPPPLAPRHIVLLPLWREEQQKEGVLSYCKQLADRLRQRFYEGEPIRVTLDEGEIKSSRHWEFIKKGVPLVVEVGSHEVNNHTVCIRRRDCPPQEKVFLHRDEFTERAPHLLCKIHESLYQKALAFQEKHTHFIHTHSEFQDFFTPISEGSELHGGFALAYAADDATTQAILEERKITARCIPLSSEHETGRCIFTGKPNARKILFAKAY